jgi:hypothetical protein
MLAILTLTLALQAAPRADSVTQRPSGVLPTAGAPADSSTRSADAATPALSVPVLSARAGLSVPDAATRSVAVADTVRPRARPRPVEYSDWYERRLTIHKWASYATLPLFAAQYSVGERLLRRGGGEGSSLRSTHGMLAGGITVLFGLNTITGLPNLWEARDDPAGRRWRTAHALLMLAADAGFVATGAMAGDGEGDNEGFGAPVPPSPGRANAHRTVAIVSMSTALVSYLMMLPPFRRD